MYFFALFVEERRCVDIFPVLSFGTVGWFDMGIWLVLRDAWRFVLEMCEGPRDIFKHGDMGSASRVILVDVHTKVPLAVPIV